jgi:hypothetical protein
MQITMTGLYVGRKKSVKMHAYNKIKDMTFIILKNRIYNKCYLLRVYYNFYKQKEKKTNP